MKNENVNSVVGLDVGTSRIVAAWREADHYKYESQLNAFVSVPYAKMTEAAFRREGVPYVVQNQQLMVHGNEAPRFADLLNVETRRPMTQGVLNPSEADGATVVRRIVQDLTQRTKGAKSKVCFSIPAAPLNGDEGLTYHEATLRQLFGELGCEVQSINEGMAVVYSELEDTNYTGIGVSLGGGLCNVALSYLSMPAMSFSIAKAGDFIDQSAALVTGDLANRIRIEKEARFHFNGQFVDQLHQVLSVYYEDMVASLLAAMKEAFSNAKRMPKLSKPIPIVLSGGTASPKGFRDRFDQMLRASDFPIAVSEIRIAKDPMTATARGALVAALAEM